jgi:adenine phosphoribosyltransferase
MKELEKYIRDIPDFPKPGIIFKDISPLLENPKAFMQVIDAFSEHFVPQKMTKVIGIDARGFIFGAALAYRMGVGFIPVRKPGKLPYETISCEYELEYGTNTLEMHIDSIEPGDRVVVIDDLLATGGTAKAACDLIEKKEGVVLGLGFLIELEFLKGREKLPNREILSLLKYS